MFCIIYQFKIHQGVEEKFIKSWEEVTKAFKKHCGALGSRLHKNNECDYIAYAQWPSKEVYDKAELPEEVINGAFSEMRSHCKSVAVLYELTPVSDLLENININDS